MNLLTPEDGYHFRKETIQKAEELYKAKYLGYWCTKTRSGNWNEQPVDVFYQPKPDVSKGHTHYFGLFQREGQVFICDASSAFSEAITGIDCGDGAVIVSRYRHDYVGHGPYFIDGGRDYVRCGGAAITKDMFVDIAVKDGEFVLTRK